MSKKLLVVIGATGQQGGSVVASVLADTLLSKEYAIRGTTRDVSKPAAQALVGKGVEMVAADVHDTSSLRQAFTGAHTAFAGTVTVYDGHTLEHEVTEGRALADAAVAAGVPYYIYSTLPHAGRNSGGTLKHMGHFDGKAEVEDYVRTLPLKSAFISPGCFMSNFHASLAPRPVGDGTFALANFVRPDTDLPLIATADDTGKWVTAILADFPRYEGQTLSCATALWTFQQVVDAMSRASGKTVVYRQLPKETWRSFLPEPIRDHMADMLEYFQDFGYFGMGTEEKVKWTAAQARGKLTTLNEWLTANPLHLE